MKTLLICSLTIILGISSCQLDNDLVSAGLESNTIFEKPEIPTADVPSVYGGYCQAIHSEHYMTGKGQWEKIDNIPNERNGSKYFLYVSGIGELDGETGRSKLSLQYDPATKSFSGVLTSQFESARMDHTFSGVVINHFTIENDIDPLIFGESNQVRGSMTTKYGVFFIREKVTLELSAVPTREGETNVKVVINGVYCAQDIFVR